MMHELLKLKEAYLFARQKGIKCIMATVAALDGSSYRRPGVRMLVFENNTMTGAVSGGCVENEILKQSASVLQDDSAKMMVYDGRYRLGCEGILYILLEPFSPDTAFWDSLETALQRREPLEIASFYTKTEGCQPGLGSQFRLGGREFPFFETPMDATLSVFTQLLEPRFQLIIIGGEHDAVQLCYFASLSGWEVTVVTSISDPKTKVHFPGAAAVTPLLPEAIGSLAIDSQTAVVLMTHSYATDLKFLIALKNTPPVYLGLLGPAKRRDQLLNEFIDYTDSYEERLLDVIYGPAGINIGAETPQEIAVSIIAEILSVTRQQEPVYLKYKKAAIHSQIKSESE